MLIAKDEELSESDKISYKNQMANWRVEGLKFLEGMAEGLGLKTTNIERELIDPFAIDDQKSVLCEAFKPLTKEIDTYMQGSMVLWSKSEFFILYVF